MFICDVSVVETPTVLDETRETVRNSRNKGNGDSDKRNGARPSAESSQISSPWDNEESPSVTPCSVCHLPIQGLFITCLSCRHVFHLNHFLKWFEENEECPILDCRCCCNHCMSDNDL